MDIEEFKYWWYREKINNPFQNCITLDNETKIYADEFEETASGEIRFFVIPSGRVVAIVNPNKIKKVRNPDRT